MLTTVQGRYVQGSIQLDEVPPGLVDSPVIVTFLTGGSAPVRRNRPIGLAPDRGRPLPAEFDAAPPPEVGAAFRGEGE
jgi:hypothetical protein